MSEKSKPNNISFRLNDEDHKRLNSIADTYDIQKSTMATNIIVNFLNENMEELLLNHISYPRPIMKKVFSLLNQGQLKYLINDLKEYNKGIVCSAMQIYPPEKIIALVKKWMKKSGCEVSITTFQIRKILEVHHEMEKNWSTVTCVVTAYILELLGFQIKRTFIDDNWFKIEYYDL